MKGLELCRAFYEAVGKPMLERHFGELLGRVAVGLVGHGSECFGFDDAVSRDHDFEPSFSLWLTDEDMARYGEELMKAYIELPKSFMGVSVQGQSALGSNTRGVQTIHGFYRYYTGCNGVPETPEAWANIPSFYLAEATNGEVFSDPLGEFSEIRRGLLEDMPEDARKKRLASSLLLMAQSGQYNVMRAYKRGEYAAAHLALSRFAEAALQAIYLLNHQYAPYYKWIFRKARQLPILAYEVKLLDTLVCNPLGNVTGVMIDEIASGVIKELKRQGYADGEGGYLEPYAFRIHETIRDDGLRSMPIILD